MDLAKSEMESETILNETESQITITDETCRLCLNLNAKNNIFQVHKGTSSKYSSMLQELTSVVVKDQDGLPAKICGKCARILTNFYKFKKTVLVNDLTLRKALGISNDTNNMKIEFLPIKFEKEKSISDNKIIIIPLDETVENENGNIARSEPKLRTDEICFVTDSGSSSDNEDMEDNNRKENLKKATRKDNNDLKTHQCDICGKILSCKSNLTQHLRKHTGERPYSCDICDKRFFKAEHALIHKRIHTGERPHKCLICSRQFIQFATLKAHLRTHSGERPHQCSICGKAFSQASSLVYHNRTHSGETPFKCDMCTKAFKNVGNLNIHMRFHQNDRPYTCQLCSKKFVTSSHLNVHLKQHKGEKPHKCVVCGKAFVRSEHLKGHLVIHSGQKPHACTMCPKKYTQSSHLKRHMKTHNIESEANQDVDS